ncbi:uncharacterized protein [Dysidea avara]|uniref:uncharacterized protein isoform X3 n=1 Tax=Dysidea avara TaxID=196820 RepID=UPI003328D704
MTTMVFGEVFALVVLVVHSLSAFGDEFGELSPHPQTNPSCDHDPPVITTVTFHEYVEILVGYNRTFSCVIRSDIPLEEGYPKWTRQYERKLPDHVITTGDCPTLSHATCSNLTLINVSQSDGSGHYTITAENECGSDNFTVNVEVVTHVPSCLNGSDLPPLITPPPPKVRAVEGQTVIVTATYKGDINSDELKAYWIVNTMDHHHKNVFPGNPPQGYNATVEECPVKNPFCCEFHTSIVLESITLNQSHAKLKSAACRSSDLTNYEEVNSTIEVYKIPTILDVPNKGSENLTTGHSTIFTCTYNASSDPYMTVTMWSLNGKLLTHNTSHFTMITEFYFDYLHPDQVKSTLIISNVNHGIGGTYTCWCEYNKSMIYENEVFRSGTASVNLTVISGSHHSDPPLVTVILGAVLGFAFVLLITTFASCCYYKRKRKHSDSTTRNVSETTSLLGDQNSASLNAMEQAKPLQNFASGINGDTGEEGLTPSHQKSLQQPGSSMVTGVGNFETVKEKGHETDERHQQVSAPTAGKEKPAVQEKPSNGHSSVAEAKHQVTREESPPFVNRFPTFRPIESDKEAPKSGKLAITSHETDALVKSLPIRPISSCGTNTEILNCIAIEFTKLVNLDTLQPYLLAHQMLTDDETYICRSSTPPTKNTKELLRLLKQKGSEGLQKLLCCLTIETSHSGHKVVATKLKDAMELCNFNGKLVCPVCKKPILNNDKLISGQTPITKEEGLTPSHQRSLQLPGSSMVTGAGNFEEEERKKDQQYQGNNGFLAPQQVVVSTTPSLESANPHSVVSAPAGRDGRMFVQEETSASQLSVTETDDHITNVSVISEKSLKRLSTSEPIDSVKETPATGKPVLTIQTFQETTVLTDCITPEEFDVISKALNHIAVEFTQSINLETLFPYLQVHQMLTDAEAYNCLCQLTPPSERAQELLKNLRHKGTGVLQKLLCCLNKETEHTGHKGVTAKLVEAMELYKFANELACPVCEPPKELVTGQKPDMLDEMFALIQVNFPIEKWEGLANAIELSKSEMEHIRTLSATTECVTMVLQRWRQLHPQATKEELIDKLHHANLGYVMQ